MAWLAIFSFYRVAKNHSQYLCKLTLQFTFFIWILMLPKSLVSKTLSYIFRVSHHCKCFASTRLTVAKNACVIAFQKWSKYFSAYIVENLYKTICFKILKLRFSLICNAQLSLFYSYNLLRRVILFARAHWKIAMVKSK